MTYEHFRIAAITRKKMLSLYDNGANFTSIYMLPVLPNRRQLAIHSEYLLTNSLDFRYSFPLLFAHTRYTLHIFDVPFYGTIHIVACKLGKTRNSTCRREIIFVFFQIKKKRHINES